jgi:hypothetical protein
MSTANHHGGQTASLGVSVEASGEEKAYATALTAGACIKNSLPCTASLHAIFANVSFHVAADQFNVGVFVHSAIAEFPRRVNFSGRAARGYDR